MKSVIACLLLLALPPSSSLAATRMGSVLIACSVVTASLDNAGLRTLSKESDVYLGEAIATGSNRLVVLKLKDNSKTSLRPQSEVTLEYCSLVSSLETVLFELIKGGLRATSGDIGNKRPQHYRVEPSVATLGIRGTGCSVRPSTANCRDEENTLGPKSGQNAGPAGGSAARARNSSDWIRMELGKTVVL